MGDAARAAPVLLCTTSALLRGELLRLAAAADVPAEPAAEIAGLPGRWSAAPLVVVGADMCAAVVAAGLPRRPGVVLVAGQVAGQEVGWPPVEAAVGTGAQELAVLPDDEQRLVGLLAASREAGTTPASVIAVVGGRGGAGASVLAAGLAVTALRRGLRTLLVDADPLGGGVDLLLGAEGSPGLRWPELSGARGRVPARALAESLVRVGALSVLSWDRTGALEVPVEAVTSLLDAAVRGCELVVVDLPRRPDAGVREIVSLAVLVLLVVPAELRACAAAGRVHQALLGRARRVEVVVRPGPAGLAPREVAAALGLPLAGALRAEAGLAAALERGQPPARCGRGPLAALCAAVLDTVPAPAT